MELSFSWEAPVAQPFNDFPTFYGTRSFNTAFTRALHWSLSWARSIQSIPPHPIYPRSILILSRFRGDYRWGMDWWMDLLTIYTHRSELQLITALSLISTIYKSPQQQLSLFLACRVFSSRSLATASNSGNLQLNAAQVLSSQPPFQNSTLNLQLTIHWSPELSSL
jgi:hypothetical protein